MSLSLLLIWFSFSTDQTLFVATLNSRNKNHERKKWKQFFFNAVHRFERLIDLHRESLFNASGNIYFLEQKPNYFSKSLFQNITMQVQIKAELCNFSDGPRMRSSHFIKVGRGGEKPHQSHYFVQLIEIFVVFEIHGCSCFFKLFQSR